MSNAFALDSRLIDFVMPNAERVKLFGEAVFARDWLPLITHHKASVLAAYHEDVIPKDLDDVIDLGAQHHFVAATKTSPCFCGT